MNQTIPAPVLEKEEQLKRLLSQYGKMAVAYSGGLDSTYLADVAHEVLGADVHLILADAPMFPRSEMAEAMRIAKERAWKLVVIPTGQCGNEAFLKNDERRCYYCKRELFARMKQYAIERGLRVLAHGETVDDTLDPTRLGNEAARERGVVAPLQAVGLSKEEIRQLSARRELPTWDKAPLACLATRIPTGTPLTEKDLAKVERAEEVLKGFGLRQYRARHHGDLCRIEVESNDFRKVLDSATRDRLVSQIVDCGYRYVTLDLVGYRTGSVTRADASP